MIFLSIDRDPSSYVTDARFSSFNATISDFIATGCAYSNDAKCSIFKTDMSNFIAVSYANDARFSSSTHIWRISLQQVMHMQMMQGLNANMANFIAASYLFYLFIEVFKFNANKSKKEGKDQESIQSSTTPDPGCQWESDNFTIRHHKREPRGQPFPSR